MATNTYGGGRSQHAVIGNAPESRDWTPGDAAFQPWISPSVRIEAFATIDAGLKTPTVVGARSWILKHAHIGHDAYVGADVEVSTGAIIGGHAEIGDGARIGLGAVVLPYRKVGIGAVVGAGAVVTHNVAAHTTVVGNPARVLEDSKRDPRPHTERAARTAPRTIEIPESAVIAEHQRSARPRPLRPSPMRNAKA